MANAAESSTWPAAALAKIALLEDALLAERERAKALEAERDRVRAAYQQQLVAIELLLRRIQAARAERVDTKQLELEFDARRKELDKLAGKLAGDPNEPEGPPPKTRKRKPSGRRDLSEVLDAPEERVEVTDPEMERLVAEGKAERFGFDVESSAMKWRRGGPIRLVVGRVKYRLGKLEGLTPAAGTEAASPAPEAEVAALAAEVTTTEAEIAPEAEVAAPDAAVASGDAAENANDARAPEVTTAEAEVTATADESAAVHGVDAPAATDAAGATAAARPTGNVDESGIIFSRPRVDRSAGTTLVTAAMPPSILPRAMGTPSLYAHIIHEKFRRGLPFFRQEQQMEVDGFPLDRGTMSRWTFGCGARVGPLIDAMRLDAKRTAFCIATDATHVLVQPAPREDKKRQPCKTGHFFAVVADRDHVLFEYTEKEDSKAVMRIFRGYEGYVQADAKSVFDILFRPEGGPPPKDPELAPDGKERDEVGCWSHARRKFFECAITSKDPVAKEALFRIGRLFEYEEQWRKLAPAQRKVLRDQKSRPELESFFAWRDLEWMKVEHQRGLLRSALGYAHNHREALMRYLEDGRLEMDNNRTEREIKNVVMGRKAWLFVGSDDHGVTTANLLSLVASAKLHGLDDEQYLRDLFRVLPFWPEDRLIELAPKYWRATRERLVPAELEPEIGWITVPLPLDTPPPAPALGPGPTVPALGPGPVAPAP